MDWQENVKREMGERIKRARQRGGITQREIAAEMGVKRQSVAQWESGENAVSGPQLARLSHLLHVSANWLCGQPTNSNNPGPASDDLEDLLATALSIARQQRRSSRYNKQTDEDVQNGYSNHQNRRALAVMVG